MANYVEKRGKSYRVWRTQKDPPSTPVFYGVELEMSACDVGDAEHAEYRAYDILDFVHVGEDCSVARYGMEFRFDPCTYNFWNEKRHDVSNFMAEMVGECYLRSDAYHDAGLHIHINGEAFSRLHLFKFLGFVYDNPEFAFKVSRRERETLRAWARLDEEESRARKAYKLKTGEASGFGEAVCLQATTVEVRLFQGTESSKEFYQSLEFVDALVEYTREESLRKVSVNGLVEFTHGHKSRYPDFYSWVETYS